MKALELSPQEQGVPDTLGRQARRSSSREMTVTELRDIASAVDGLADSRWSAGPSGAQDFPQQHRSGRIAARLRRWERGGPPLGLRQRKRGPSAWGNRRRRQVRRLRHDDFLDNEEVSHAPHDLPLSSSRAVDRRQAHHHRHRRVLEGAPGPKGFAISRQTKLKTIRKQNGLICLRRRAHADAIVSRSPHHHRAMPDTDLPAELRGDRGDYVDGFKLTEREYELIARELSVESRRFVLKQGHNSVVAELNLSGSMMSSPSSPAGPRMSNLPTLSVQSRQCMPRTGFPFFQQRKECRN
ncbi:hypothetical protein F2981_19390 (plasmid) [Sinorhizobium meliloti]|nr:hypothetical protein [Sinorhizobium meliloti]